MEMPVDETVGLDLMLDKVRNSIEEEDVGVIGLYGMGGAGKTTLLRKINNQFDNRRSSFDIVMWVVVSRELNFDSIMDSISKYIGIRDDIWNKCSNKDEKAARIYRVLKRMKFLLLLDDIWEQVDLRMVGVPNPKDTNFQSKVLFTTRSKDVCYKMQAQRRFKVECLMEKEAFELFCMKVGEETLQSHPDIPKLARDMALACKGLPLALVVVGSAMAGVKSLQAWQHSKNNLTTSSWIASDLETKVFSILKFSYDQLPDETHKNCFLYCALYPEDCEIQVFNLIDKWIGEGFLGKDTTKSIEHMHIHGESIIEKLKLSCLLENVEDKLFLHRKVKMHDAIRDMALWIACDHDKSRKRILVEGDTFAVSQDDVEMWKIVERISIIQCGKLLVPIVPCPNLTSLTFALTEDTKITLDLLHIQYMSKLKVLDLSGAPLKIMELPTQIGGLVHLEYLSLKGQMYASQFPMELKNLKNLKYFTLHVSSGDLAFIPLEVISSLEELRVLRFSTTTTLRTKNEEEREFLDKVESLQHLEELWIQIRSKNGVMKLLESTKLQNCVWSLDLKYLENLIDMPLLLASMSKMKHLQKVLFFGLNYVEDSCVYDTFCLSMLRNVSIHRCNSITHVTWLKYAPLLQVLMIRSCESLEELIYGGRRDNVDNVFSSLVELYLSDNPKLKSIHHRALCFPSLRSLEIFNCPNLKTLAFDSSFAMNKLRHIRGHQNWWDKLEWEDQVMKHKLQSKFQAQFEDSWLYYYV